MLQIQDCYVYIKHLHNWLYCMQRIIIKAIPTFFQKASLSYSRNFYSAFLISEILKLLLFSGVHLSTFLLSMTYPFKIFCQAIQKGDCERCQSMSQKCHCYNNRQKLKKKGDAVTEETSVTGVSQKCHRRINRKKK